MEFRLWYNVKRHLEKSTAASLSRNSATVNIKHNVYRFHEEIVLIKTADTVVCGNYPPTLSPQPHWIRTPPLAPPPSFNVAVTYCNPKITILGDRIIY